MPRTARASVGGICYHVINRVNGRSEVFHEEADYLRFIDMMGQACERLPMRVPAWCLLPNHFHLVGSKIRIRRIATRLGLETSLRPRGRPRKDQKK